MYEFELTSLAAERVLSVRQRIEPGTVPAAVYMPRGLVVPGVVGVLLRDAFRLIRDLGLEISGPPIAEYFGTSDPTWDVQASVPTQVALSAKDSITPQWSYHGPIARTIHVGPYENRFRAHQALLAWLQSTGRQANGPVTERYVTNPSNVRHPARWRTEVYCAVKSGS